MVIREDQIGERVKYWVRPDIINRIKEGTIKAYFNAQVIEIQESKVVIGTPEGNFTIPNDCVIAATGYQPDLDLLSVMGIKLSTDTSKRPVYDEETHESNIKGIYLAGVICGGMDTHSLFIENSREHAEKIIDHIVSNLN
jgi:thioredoxin reductase (NADPH)